MICIIQVATLTKADLKEVVTLRGRVNRSSVRFNDEHYDAETLVLLGFAGTRGADGLFHGEYRFREATNQDDEAERINFGRIPRLLAATTERAIC